MKAITCGIWAACVLMSCHEDETCREILCAPAVTVTLNNPISESYDLSVKVRGRDLTAHCPGQIAEQKFALLCDAKGFTLRSVELFQDVGAPPDVEVIVSSIKAGDRQIADNIVLRAKVTGSMNPGCPQSCYLASAILKIPPI